MDCDKIKKVFDSKGVSTLNKTSGFDLLNYIESTRNLMIRIGLQEGLTDPKTIKVSQELDRLLNMLSEGKREQIN